MPLNYDRFTGDDTRRPCIGDCGLAAEPGDVYCTGCREGFERDAAFDRMDGSDSLRT